MSVKPALNGRFPIPGTDWYGWAGEGAAQAAVEMARRGPVAVDLETYGLDADAWRLKCVSISDGTTCVVLDPRDQCQHTAIQDAIMVAPRLLFWNSPFDCPPLVQSGLLSVNQLHKVTDALIWARLAQPDPFTPKSLEAVADRLGVRAKTTPIKETFKQLGLSTKEGFHRFDIDNTAYLFGAALDGIVTFLLTPMVRKTATEALLGNPFKSMRVEGDSLERLLEREQIVNRVMLRRACLGIRVDFDFADQYRRDNGSEIAKLEGELKQYGIKPGNGNSLLDWMDGEGLIGPDHPKTPTGKMKATAEVLEGLSHPIAAQFVAHKRLVKVDRDYLAKLEDLSRPTGGRIHPRTNIFAAVTGRSSIGSPPLQQLPPEARGILIPDEGETFASIDFKQIEPVLIAYLARDHAVLSMWEASDDADLYTDVAALAAASGKPITRKVAKVVLLAQLYGQGMAKLSNGLELDPGPLIQREDGTWTHTYDEARDLRDSIFDAMPATSDLMKKVKDVTKKFRMSSTISGRPVPVAVYRNKESGEEEVASYRGVNYLVQGSAYDLLAESIVRCHAAGLSEAIYFGIHDELLVADSAAQDVRRIMEQPCNAMLTLARRTPILRTDYAHLGERWGAA